MPNIATRELRHEAGLHAAQRERLDVHREELAAVVDHPRGGVAIDGHGERLRARLRGAAEPAQVDEGSRLRADEPGIERGQGAVLVDDVDELRLGRAVIDAAVGRGARAAARVRRAAAGARPPPEFAATQVPWSQAWPLAQATQLTPLTPQAATSVPARQKSPSRQPAQVFPFTVVLLSPHEASTAVRRTKVRFFMGRSLRPRSKTYPVSPEDGSPRPDPTAQPPASRARPRSARAAAGAASRAPRGWSRG